MAKKKIAAVKNYVYMTRSPLYGCVLVLPLLLLYEILVLRLRQNHMIEMRNGADVLLRNLLEYLGIHGMLTCSAVLFGGILFFTLYKAVRSKSRLRLRYFGFMIIESALLALLFGLVMGQIYSLFTLRPDESTLFTNRIILSIGAGIFEELVFRVFILTALFVILLRLFKLHNAPANLTATILSALAFAIFHYWGPGKETLHLYSFLFRFLAGLVFGILYVLRGFGITAYTHTFYDIYLDLYITTG